MNRIYLFTAAVIAGLCLPLHAADGGKQRPPPQAQGQGMDSGQGGAQGEGRRRGPPREPPPQAYELCAGQAEGAKVTINTPQGDQVEATCAKRGERLFARPDRGPPPPEGQQGQQGQGGGDGQRPPPRSEGERLPRE